MFKHGMFASVNKARFEGGFFGPIVQGVRDTMLPYQWLALNDQVEGSVPSSCIRNFRIAAGELAGEHQGFVFQDSDLGKWLEAVAYQLQLKEDPELEALADGAIALMEKAQMADGYLNTYYQLTKPDRRYTNLRDDHELYTAGHLLEAAVAYYQATGKDRFLKVMERMVAHIAQHIGPEEGKKRGYPGHQEIEMALCKLYDVTGNREYLDLAAYFIRERGQEPNYFVAEQQLLGRDYQKEGAYGLTYAQHHLPVLQQDSLEGHAVRALYMVSGMADVALRTGDEALFKACRRLYENVTRKRMYVTGGVGSSHLGEAFTFDYDLPSDTVYAETCASIALIFLCRRMLEMETDADYADTMERALYNTCLAGMSLDMQRFFYVNPLSVLPEASRRDDRKRHVLPERPPWFGCACCPPNLARLLSSLALYACSVKDQALLLHLYIQGEYQVQVGSQAVRLEVETDYPHDGRILIRPSDGEYRLLLRLPAWCREYTLSRDGQPLKAPQAQGYLSLEGPFHGTELVLNLDMPPRRVYMNPKAAEESGKTALMRGPLVYCLEEQDTGPGLHQLRLPREAALTWQKDPALPGGHRITAPGLRLTGDPEALYPDSPGQLVPQDLTFIPYHAWANRGENEMRVWVQEG